MRRFLGGCRWTVYQQEPTQTSAISATTHPPALVFYYGDVGYWDGIVRIGRFDTTMDLIEHQDDNFQVTIERS